MFKNRIKKDNGSITVEACVVLPVFISVVLTLMMLIKIITVQAIIQHSINEASKEISNYSYILSATKIHGEYKKITTKIDDNANKFNEDAQAISQGVTNLRDLTKTKDVAEVVENVSATTQSAMDIKTIGTEIMQNPKAALVNMASLFMGKGIEELNKGVFSAMAKGLTGTYIGTGNLSTDARLRMLGVHGGWEGLDFSDSIIFGDVNKEDIDIVVRYKIDLPVPIDVFPDFYITQRAITRGWLDGDASGGLKTAKDDQNPDEAIAVGVIDDKIKEVKNNGKLKDYKEDELKTLQSDWSNKANYSKIMFKELMIGINEGKMSMEKTKLNGVDVNKIDVYNLDSNGKPIKNSISMTAYVDANGKVYKVVHTVDSKNGKRGTGYSRANVPSNNEKGHIKSVDEGAKDNCIEDSPLNIIPQTRAVNYPVMYAFEKYRRDNCDGQEVTTEILSNGYVRVTVPSESIDVTYNPQADATKWPKNWYLTNGTYN